MVMMGLGTGGSLALVTQGLLVSAQAEEPVEAVDLPSVFVDVALDFDLERLNGDISVFGGDLVRETSLKTALLVSLFTDRLVSIEESEAFGSSERRGWFGDALSEIDGDRIGSKLWLLERAKVLPETLARAREYSREATQWFVDDGVSAKNVIETEWLDTIVTGAPRGVLALGIEIHKPAAPADQFAFAWKL